MTEATSKPPRAYHNGNGKFQHLMERLNKMIPATGACIEKSQKYLEAFRKASNAYTDLFNNGGINHAADIRRIFDIGVKEFKGTEVGGKTPNPLRHEEICALVEMKMDAIIARAAAEQTCF